MTDELRRMLDERGVFWIDIPLVNMKRTCWKTSEEQDGYCYFDEDAFGVTELTVTCMTPEQAIAATLGSSNCTDGERTNGADGICIRPGDLVLSETYGECTVQAVTYTVAGVACTINAKTGDATVPIVTSPKKLRLKHGRGE